MIAITVDGQTISHDATAAELAGLTAARALVMENLPLGEDRAEDAPVDERPDYEADDVAWLQSTVQEYVTRTGEDAETVMLRCLQSWAEHFV